MRHALVLVLLAACGGSGDDSPAADAAPLQADATPAADATPPLTGEYHHHVTSTMTVPTSPAEAQSLGLDIDGDGTIDNGLGGVLAALTSQGLDAQGSITAAITAGSQIMLHSLHADDLMNDDSVSWQTFVGDAHAPPPLYDGNDTFTVASASPTDSILFGSLTAGHFVGGPGHVALQLAVGTASLTLDLTGARLEAGVDASGSTDGGILGGCVTMQDIDQQIIPGVAPMVNQNVLDTDGLGDPPSLVSCTGGCPAMNMFGDPLTCDQERDLCLSANSENTLDLLDTDKDGNVTADELRMNQIIQALLAPDTDLDGDGTKECLSIGVGFTTVPAGFTAPGE